MIIAADNLRVTVPTISQAVAQLGPEPIRQLAIDINRERRQRYQQVFLPMLAAG